MRKGNIAAEGRSHRRGVRFRGDEGYRDKRALAKLLGRAVRSIDTYLSKWVIPFYKLGRTVAFKWSEVDESIKVHFPVCLWAGQPVPNVNSIEFLKTVDHVAAMSDRWLFLAAFCL